MNQFPRHVGLILWKNYLLHRRNVCRTLMDIIVVLLICSILVVLKSNLVNIKHEEPTIYIRRFLNNYTDELPPVLFFPNGTLIKNVMTEVGRNGGFRVIGFENSSAMEKFASEHPHSYGVGVAFNNININARALPNNVNVSFRPDGGFNWRIFENFESPEINIPRESGEHYWFTGFLRVQYLVCMSLIGTWKPDVKGMLKNHTISLRRMPFPPYRDVLMNKILDQILMPLIILSIMPFLDNIIKVLVVEKESKLKESVKLMGMTSAAQWVGWFLTSFLINIIITTIQVIFLCMKLTDNGAILENSSWSVIMAVFICYGILVIAFYSTISCFIHKGSYTIIAHIIFLATFVVWVFIEPRFYTMTGSAKLASCLLINTSLGYAIRIILMLEKLSVGAQWSNIDVPAFENDKISLLGAMLMMLCDSAICFLFTWYADKLMPGEFGVPHPWYFPFQKSYWTATPPKSVRHSREYLPSRHFETGPMDLPVGIQIKHLTKTFKKGRTKTVAVNDINMNVYNGQITALLGHNGAGKTTTMSMLTGLFPPTSGTAVINGYDIRTDIDAIHGQIGLCPQHNILFDSLTVIEHLMFFTRLKGKMNRRAYREAEVMAKNVGLDSNMDDLSKTLSGGQKRKLSVAIAFIGGSKIIILDEPTSGMDPAARRQTWDVIQKFREGRTIVMTTHYMDEADVLGDRIAIMAEGVIQCYGTSMFLKKLYGTGYHLIIVKDSQCVVQSITEVITGFIQNSQLESNINAELSYLLPDTQSKKFAALFDELEKKREELHIISFGITATTLEEVFLKVGLESKAKGSPSQRGTDRDIVLDVEDSNHRRRSVFTLMHMKRGMDLHLSKLMALFIKKVIYSVRNIKINLFQFIFIPLVVTLFAMDLPSLESNEGKKSLKLDLSTFERTITPYTDGKRITQHTKMLAESYTKLFSGADTLQRIDRTAYPLVEDYFLNKISEINNAQFNKIVMIGGQFEEEESVGHFNGQAIHTQPISLAYIMNSLTSRLIGDTFSITQYNHPFPLKKNKQFKEQFNVDLSISYIVAIVLVFGMSFFQSRYVYFLVDERSSGAKHLQRVSGVGPLIYWISNFAWDYISFMIACCASLVMFVIIPLEPFVQDGHMALVVLTYLVYGLSALPLMYTVQFIFKSPATGSGVMSFINGLIGMFPLGVVMVFELFEILPDVANTLRWCFISLIPHYSFGKAIQSIYINHKTLQLCNSLNYKEVCRFVSFPCCKGNCGKRCFKFDENFLTSDEIGIMRPLVFMLSQGIVLFILALCIDYKVLQSVWQLFTKNRIHSSSIVKDSDVKDEISKIHELCRNNRKQNTGALIICDLCKQYGDFVAVDHLCLGVPEKECFGLLGQNGAGKTTLFKMLTGDIPLTSGNAYFRSYPIRSNIKQVHQMMGYCPQFDGLNEELTGWEILYMYSRLKGVPGNKIKSSCKVLIELLGFESQALKLISSLSGGNKRRLSTAISLIGNPSFILLDEPSSGMDPKAKRDLWNALSKVRASGKTLILTTQSMEECEALCTRIAIMVNGQFRCLGSAQHLKSKFAQGYSLIMKMSTSSDGTFAPTKGMVEYIFSKFTSASVFDDHAGYLHFQVPQPDVLLAYVFTVMENAKTQFKVDDYTVHQTTLEQVFLQLAKEQKAQDT